MGILSFFGAGKAAGEAVKGSLEGVGTLAKDLRAAITNDLPAEKKAEIELKLQKMDAEILLAQSEINKAEAQSSSFFIAGARPALLWIMVCAFGLNYVIFPLLSWGLALAKIYIILPVMDVNSLYPLLIGMLGLGSLRTYEKKNGVQNNH